MFRHGPEDISPDEVIDKLRRLQRENRSLRAKLQALEGKDQEQEQSHRINIIEEEYVPSYYRRKAANSQLGTNLRSPPSWKQSDTSFERDRTSVHKVYAEIV